MSHLLELRSRIMKAVLAVIVALLGLMPFMNTVFEYVSKPLREALPEGSEMIVAYGTAAAGGSQQHTGTQLRVAGYGPGAGNLVGLIDQTDLHFIIGNTVNRKKH